MYTLLVAGGANVRTTARGAQATVNLINPSPEYKQGCVTVFQQLLFHVRSHAHFLCYAHIAGSFDWDDPHCSREAARATCFLWPSARFESNPRPRTSVVGSALTVSCARPSAISRILTTVCFRPRLSPSAWNLQAQDGPAQVAIFGVSCGLSSRLRPFVYWLRNPRTRGYGVSQAWQKQRLLLPAGLRPRHGNRRNIHVCCTVLIRPRLGVQGSQFVFERKRMKNETPGSFVPIRARHHRYCSQPATLGNALVAPWGAYSYTRPPTISQVTETTTS